MENESIVNYDDVKPKKKIISHNSVCQNSLREIFIHLYELCNGENNTNKEDIFGGNTIEFKASISNENKQKRNHTLCLYDFAIFNAINTIYINGETNYITINEIYRNITGKECTTSPQQRKEIKESIEYLRNVVCWCNYKELYTILKTINYDNDIKEKLLKILEIYSNDKEGKEYGEHLINCDYCGQRLRTGLEIEGIYLIKPSIFYLIFATLNRIENVNLDIFKCIDIKRTTLTISIQHYIVLYLLNKTLSKTPLHLNTLYRILGLDDIQTNNEPVIYRRRAIKIEIFDYCIRIFKCLLKNEYISNCFYTTNKDANNSIKRIFYINLSKKKIKDLYIKNENAKQIKI